MKKHILLIDDDEDELDIFKEALVNIPYDCECSWVQNPEEAFTWLKTSRADYIFVDYNMPIKNGLDFLREIRGMDGFRSIPVILYSSFIDDQNYRAARSLGAFDCMRKPSEIPALTNQLKKILVG
jgi:CheY-like chemotaxis protein